MVDGLIISEDKALFEELNINFSSERNNFEYAQSTEEAKSIIDLELPDYIIVIKKSAQKAHQLLLELFKNKEIKKIPVICLLSSHEWSQRDILWQDGVKDIIQLPISKDEFKLQLDHFINNISDLTFDQEEIGMYGKLEDYNLLDLIQTLENSKKTGVLVLYRSRDEGKIWFHEGNIHDAKYRTFQPVPAILKLVSWTEGDFSISFVDEKYENLIEQDNQQILLEAIQYIDERNKILDLLPDINETLLISPEADMDTMSEDDVTYLRFFQGGQILSSYLYLFDKDDLTLLNRVKMFIEKKLLMTREEFDSHKTEQEIEVGQAGIRKVFKKIFKKKDESSDRSAKDSIEKYDETDEAIEHMDDTIYGSLFQKEGINIKEFKDKIKKI